VWEVRDFVNGGIAWRSLSTPAGLVNDFRHHAGNDKDTERNGGTLSSLNDKRLNWKVWRYHLEDVLPMFWHGTFPCGASIPAFPEPFLNGSAVCWWVFASAILLRSETWESWKSQGYYWRKLFLLKKRGGTRGTHHDTSLKVFPLFWGEPSCIVEGRVHIDLNLSPVLIGVHPTWKVVHSHGCSPALGTRHIRRIRSHVYLLVI